MIRVRPCGAEGLGKAVAWRVYSHKVDHLYNRPTSSNIPTTTSHTCKTRAHSIVIGVWGHSSGGHLVSLLGTLGHAKKLD
jgi:hypothetical protein